MDNLSNKQYGLIQKFFLVEKKVLVLIKCIEKRTIFFPELKFNFDYKNNMILKKLESFYTGFEITNTYKFIEFECILSKCIILESDEENILTEVVSINEHD